MELIEKRVWDRPSRIEYLSNKYGYKCFHPDCGLEFRNDDEVTFDHWIPQALGGTWDIHNLRLMHKSCNAKKGDALPNPDGTLPKKPTKEKVPKSQRPEICTHCASGRLLLPGEECDECGSGPQPAQYPRSLQVSPKECDHSQFHCWMCFLGFVERDSAFGHVLMGPDGF